MTESLKKYNVKHIQLAYVHCKCTCSIQLIFDIYGYHKYTVYMYMYINALNFFFIDFTNYN